MSRKMLNVLLGLAAVALGVVAYVAVGPPASAKAVTRTSTVTRGVVLTSVTATGNVSSSNQLSLSFTTGGTVKRLIKLVEEMGGQVVGIGAIWRRSNRVKFKYPLFTVVTRDFPTYSPEECPLCRKGVSVNLDLRSGAVEDDPED